jgi:ABC-type uncharacterized transport system permease subunit
MIDLLSGLLAFAMVLLGIAPVLVAGGRLIAAFMVRKHMLLHLAWTLLALGALVGAAFLALHLVRQEQRLLAAAAVCGLPWLAHWLALRLIEPRRS